MDKIVTTHTGLNVIELVAHCELRLRHFHEVKSYEDFATFQNNFTSADMVLAEKIRALFQSLDIQRFQSFNGNLRSATTEISRLHECFRQFYAPVNVTRDGECLYSAISLGLTGCEGLSAVLRFGCLGMLIQYQNKFKSHAIDPSRLVTLDNEDPNEPRKVVISCKLEDIAFVLGSTSSMIWNFEIFIPKRLKYVPRRLLIYGGPAQILSLSILINRKIYVYKDFGGERFSRSMTTEELQSCFDLNTEQAVSYEWNSHLVSSEPLSLFYYKEHFTILLPKSDHHFTINYHYLTPFNLALPEKYRPLDEFFLDCDPSCFPKDFPEVLQQRPEKELVAKYPDVRPSEDLFVKIAPYEEGIAEQAAQSSHQKIVVPMLVPKRRKRPLVERKLDKESASRNVEQFQKGQDSDDSEWFVQQILDVKTTGDGQKMYLLRWSGFSPEHDSWEPESNLSPDLLRAYQNRVLMGSKRHRVSGGSQSSAPSISVVPAVIFQLDGPYNRAMNKWLNLYTSKGWFTPLLGFNSDNESSLIAPFVELRFISQVVAEWLEFDKIEICPLLGGRKWNDARGKREACERLRLFSSKQLGFGSETSVFKSTISRVRSGKHVLGLIFSSTRCDNPNGFVHVLVTLTVGSENSKRTMRVYNPLTRASAECDRKLSSKSATIIHSLFRKKGMKTPLLRCFDRQENSADCLIWAMRFIANVADGLDYINQYEWEENSYHI